VGGAEVAVKEITDRIPVSDLEFDMVTLGDGRGKSEEQVGHVRVFRLFKDFGMMQKLLFPFAAARMADRLQRERQYDAVWGIMASYAGYAAHLFKRAYRSVPFVLTIQEGDHFGRRQGLFKPLFKKIFASADRIQAISNYLANWSGQMGARCPIDVLPNGVDFDHFAEPISVDRRNELRAELGFSAGDTVLVTASRLVYKNAVNDIISALTHLDPSYKLLILGSGKDEAALKEQAAKLKLENKVVFKGFVEHSDLPVYLQACDIFVRPSRSEGLGNSFLEAMAAGIPVIATPVGGIPDFLTDGETGLMCEVDNPRSIAQKAGKLSRDRESRDYIVRNAREMVRRKYHWDGIAERMKEIFASTELK
jgi:glycosyltransferase involved in cell wall biosynthesis